MQAQRPARLLLPPALAPGASAAADRGARRRAAPAADDLDASGRALFDALRRHRLEVARSEGVPPYVVATDRALRDVAALRPATPAELEQAHGIGPAKLRRYGAGLLEVVRRHAAATSSPPP